LNEARAGVNRPPTNDFTPKDTCNSTDLLADIELETVSPPWAYPPCSCGRPSWAFVELLLTQARRDERGAAAWAEFTADQQLSALARHAALEQIERLLRPEVKGERRFLQVDP
jgi:hypothetical protein